MASLNTPSCVWDRNLDRQGYGYHMVFLCRALTWVCLSSGPAFPEFSRQGCDLTQLSSEHPYSKVLPKRLVVLVLFGDTFLCFVLTHPYHPP